MGELPAGMPARAPNHGALTLPPSVSASPVCCRFANRTIQMVSSLLPPWPPTLATSEGQRDSLGDLWFSTVRRDSPRSWVLGYAKSHPAAGACSLGNCCVLWTMENWEECGAGYFKDKKVDGVWLFLHPQNSDLLNPSSRKCLQTNKSTKNNQKINKMKIFRFKVQLSL